MIIKKSNIILAEDYSNVLVEDFVKYYPSLKKLSTPKDTEKLMNDVFHLSEQAEEYVYLIAMTAKCRPISFFEVAHGTCTASLVGTREIFVRALLCGAVNLILIHNHPSGLPQPSREDIEITKQLKEASRLLGVQLCDHIIIGKEGYYSFAENKEEHHFM